jgi:hypothetical protein
MSLEIIISTISVLLGLTIRFIITRLGIKEPLERTSWINDLINNIVIRRNTFQTFLRLSIWNFFISFLLIVSGFFTFGLSPVIWIFLNLGIFMKDINMFKRYFYSWFETIAIILSASLGIWGGLRIDQILNNSNVIPITIPIVIIILYVSSALLES